MLGKKPRLPLYGYQNRWRADQSRFKLWVKSVQIGASFVQAVEAVEDCVNHKVLWIFLSASDRQALELGRKAADICKAINAVMEYHENQYFQGTSINQHSIEFPNGARIIMLPANPDTARGFAGNVVLDEFAIHRDATEIWRAAFGRASRGYKIRVLSSPKGTKGKFFELAKELNLTNGIVPDSQPVKNGVWSGHWTDIHLAVREGCPLNIAEQRAGAGDEETWQQEYECAFLSEAANYIPLEMIVACESSEAWVEPPAGWVPQGQLYWGFDVGRVKDLSVLVVVEKLGDTFWVRRMVEMPRARFATQEKLIADTVPTALRGAIDASGMGMDMSERLATKYPGRVEPVAFTMSVKQDLAVNVKKQFENRTIRIPDHRLLRRDINAVKKIITDAGNIRFDAERTEAGHADRFWALALALHAADKGVKAACVGRDPVSTRDREYGFLFEDGRRRPSVFDMDQPEWGLGTFV